jgi:hypothetical protein
VITKLPAVIMMCLMQYNEADVYSGRSRSHCKTRDFVIELSGFYSGKQQHNYSTMYYNDRNRQAWPIVHKIVTKYCVLQVSATVPWNIFSLYQSIRPYGKLATISLLTKKS